jgi:smoothened protein
MDPMKEVENPFNYYEGFEGCGLKCQDPFFSDEEHDTASNWIWYLGIVTVLCNGCVVVSFD